MSKLRSDFWQTADMLELILALSDEAAGDSWNPRGCPHHWLFLWDRAIGSEGGKLKVVARGGKTRRRVTRTQLREGTPPIGALYSQATTFPVKSRWVDMWTAVLRMKVGFLESHNPPNHHDIRLTSNRNPSFFIQGKKLIKTMTRLWWRQQRKWWWSQLVSKHGVQRWDSRSTKSKWEWWQVSSVRSWGKD